jgi:hypothetical protein
MRKLFPISSLFALILLLFLVNHVDKLIPISGENLNSTTFVNNGNNTNLDISNLVYDINSNPFNVSILVNYYLFFNRSCSCNFKLFRLIHIVG